MTNFYVKTINNIEEIELSKLFSREFLYYYNIFISIKIEFEKVNQTLPKYVVFDETFTPNQLIVYIFRDNLMPENITNYIFDYICIREGLDSIAMTNSREDFIIKFHLL